MSHMRDWKTLKLASLETMLVNTQGWLVMFHERLLPLMVVQVDEFGFEIALFSDQLEKTELDLASMARLEVRMADFGAWYRGLKKMVEAQRLNPVWPFSEPSGIRKGYLPKSMGAEKPDSSQACVAFSPDDDCN